MASEKHPFQEIPKKEFEQKVDDLLAGFDETRSVIEAAPLTAETKQAALQRLESARNLDSQAQAAEEELDEPIILEEGIEEAEEPIILEDELEEPIILEEASTTPEQSSEEQVIEKYLANVKVNNPDLFRDAAYQQALQELPTPRTFFEVELVTEEFLGQERQQPKEIKTVTQETGLDIEKQFKAAKQKVSNDFSLMIKQKQVAGYSPEALREMKTLMRGLLRLPTEGHFKTLTENTSRLLEKDLSEIEGIMQAANIYEIFKRYQSPLG